MSPFLVYGDAWTLLSDEGTWTHVIYWSSRSLSGVVGEQSHTSQKPVKQEGQLFLQGIGVAG